jgi:hypothetical protein
VQSTIRVQSVLAAAALGALLYGCGSLPARAPAASKTATAMARINPRDMVM